MRRSARLGLGTAALLMLVGFWEFFGSASAQQYVPPLASSYGSAGSTSAQPAIGELPSGDIFGKVVDPDQKPVAGATVWLAVVQAEGEPRVIEKAVSDAQGQFHFSPIDGKSMSGISREAVVVAKDAEGRIGGRVLETSVSWDSWYDDEEASSVNVIHIQDVERWDGRVVDLAGKPVRGAKVRPFMIISRYDGAAGFVFLVPELADELTALTDADGQFVLRTLARAYTSIQVSASGHGRARHTWTVGEPMTIRLGPPTTVRGKLTRKDASGTLAGIAVYATVESGDDTSGFGDYVTSREDGTFQFDGLPTGKCTIEVFADGTQPYYCNSPAEVEVKAHETVSGVTLAMERAVAVRGKVVDRKTGEGIPAALVQVSCKAASGESLSRTGITDIQGDYCVYIRPGKINVGLVNMESATEPVPPDTRADSVPATADVQYPTITTDRLVMVEGIVVDEQGRPVSGAHVFVMRLSGNKRKHLRSDDRGKFTIPGLPPAETCGLCARTDQAASEPWTGLVPEKMTEPLRIVLSEKQACTVRGTCMDQTGKPVPNVEITVSVWHETPDALLPIARFRRSWKPAANGQFAIPGLWAGLKVDIDFDAVNHDQQEVNSPALPQGEHDLGMVVLTAIDGAIEGVVRDSQGQPVAEAKVFNRGDAPLERLGDKEVSSVTDAAGHFRLQGFRPGWAYVFVKKEGRRFTAVRAPVGATDVAVTLLGSDEPVPAWSPPELPSPADQQKLARKILERLIVTEGFEQKSEAAWAMARMEPETVLKWADRAQDEEREFRMRAAFSIADSDLDEAISLLEENDHWAFLVLMAIAERYETADPAKSLRCAEEMVVRARALDQPKQAKFLAKAATRVIRAGEKESGRKLAEEAADAVAGLPESAGDWTVRMAVAEALGASDLERAARFVESGDTDALAWASSAASFEELPKAEAMLKKVDEEGSLMAGEARARLVRRMAAHSEDALRVLGGFGTDGIRFKVVGLGWIAVAAAPRDRELACSLIDQALAICVQPPKDAYYYDFGHPAVLAALLALQAQQIGYPDMNSVVARVLAAREGMLSEDTDRLAAVLAQLDPQASRHVLEAAEGVRRRHPEIVCDRTGELAAWVLIDWQHAEERIEQEFSAQVEKKDDRDLSALLFAAEQLSLTGEDRWKHYERHLLEYVLSEDAAPW